MVWSGSVGGCLASICQACTEWSPPLGRANSAHSLIKRLNLFTEIFIALTQWEYFIYSFDSSKLSATDWSIHLGCFSGLGWKCVLIQHRPFGASVTLCYIFCTQKMIFFHIIE